MQPVTAAVEVEAVSRRFGATLAVDRVSLSVAPGEFVSLLGPSGCGKTTLLRLIGGFETPDSGRIRILGIDATDTPPHQRRTNMVFQHLALFPHRNVAENIGFGLRMRRVPPAEIAMRVRKALEMVRLEGYDERRIDQISGGQKQRVAIARAIINEPSVLLLDEPLGALDLRLRLELQEELRRLQRSLGSPFIFVTHDQGEAMAMSDRIAVMNAGRIEQIGTPEQIYSQPASRFVAQFVGHTNLLDGVIDEVLGSGRYIVIGGGLRIACHGATGFAKGAPVSLSVRQENVAIRREPLSDPGWVSFRGEVQDKVFMGASVRIKVAAEGQTTLLSETVAAAGNAGLVVGDKVQIGWPIAEARLFERGV